MRKIHKTTLLNILIIVIYLVLPFVFFRDILKINEVFFGIMDAPIFTIPLRELTIEFFKNFDLPFWNSYIYSGFPLAASPEAYVFYPITLLIDLFFPITLSYNLSLLLHYSFAGIFLYLFLNEYKLSKLSCFIGGLIFMFSGIMVTHRSHPQMIFPIVWFPLILFFIEKYRKSERFEFILLASIFYSIAFLGGHAQMFVLGTIVLLFYIIYYSLIYAKLQYKQLLKLILIFPISIVIVCIQLIPSIELMFQSVRETYSYTAFIEGSFKPKMFLAIFFPFIYGSQYPALNIPPYFGPFIYGENMIYFGISTFVLLLINFFSKNKHKYFWIFILLFSIFLVFGEYNPLYKFLYYVPIYNKFRIPARNWFEFGLAFSILAAIGFDYFLKNQIMKVKKAVIISVSSTVFVVSSILFLLYSLKYNLFDKVNLIFKKINITDLELESLLDNISIKNYAVIVPIIIITVTVLIFLISLIRKNKIIYGFLIILIFLDLLSFGYYYEENTRNDYLNISLDNYENLNFLNTEKENFRVFSNIYAFDQLRIIPNMNIHYDLYSIGGYDSLILNDYNYITKIPDNPSIFESYIKILKNNLVISKLNTKFIIMGKPENLNNFMDSINQVYYLEENSKLIIDESKYEKAMIENISINKDKEIIFNGKNNSLKLFQIPISIKEEKSYLIKFKIKKESELDNSLIIDCYGINYDNPEQETEVYNRDITSNFQTMQKMINTDLIPIGETIYLRFFTFSRGKFIIKDIEVFEVCTKKENGYEIVYDDGNYIILENKNVKDRFYFSNRIKGVKNIEEVHSLFWSPIKFSEKSYIYTTDFVENLDIKGKNFNVNDAKINILDYKNNNIKLETKTKEENLLVFTDTYYPGWKAYLNGAETNIYRVNGASKGILVPKGENHIVFLFSPTYFKLLVTISLLSLAVVIFFIIRLFYINNRNKFE